MNRRSFSFTLLCLAVAFGVGGSPVLAQDASISAEPEPTLAPPTTGIDLTISPPILNVRTEPGASFSAVLKIKNNNADPEALQIDIMKFTADETGARPKLLPLAAGDIFPQWMNFSETRFVVEGRTWKSIDFTFTPPANASPAYYFAIVFNRQIDPILDEGAIARGAPAILTLAQVSSSRVYHQLDLAQLDGGKGLGFMADHYVYEFLPANFTTTITNNGNVHELAYGNIFIDWLTGNRQDVEILDVNRDKSFTLPQTTRSFYTTWSNGFPHWEDQKDDAGSPILDKKGEVKRKLVWDLAKIPTLRIGKYRATLMLIYNDGVRDIPLEAQTEFWVIPWRILLVVLVVLILIIIGIKGTIQSAWDKLKTARARRRPPSSFPTPTNH